MDKRTKMRVKAAFLALGLLAGTVVVLFVLVYSIVKFGRKPVFATLGGIGMFLALYIWMLSILESNDENP